MWGARRARALPDGDGSSGLRVTSRIMPIAGAVQGGDWCEAFAVSDDLLGLSIGDISGHGDGAHAAMSAVREAIRDAARAGLDPAQTLAAANAFLRRYDANAYATAVFGLLSVRRHRFTFANAGHPAPLLTGFFGAAYLEFQSADLPLGVDRNLSLDVHRVDVPPASLLVLYTDGVTEHERKPLQGAAQLREAALFAYNFAALPTADVIGKQMFLTGPNLDDAAILAVWSAADGAAPVRLRGAPSVRSSYRRPSMRAEPA
jgi:serine phosphatase RsbU (regulator of sigma subunit)